MSVKNGFLICWVALRFSRSVKIKASINRVIQIGIPVAHRVGMATILPVGFFACRDFNISV